MNMLSLVLRSIVVMGRGLAPFFQTSRVTFESNSGVDLQNSRTIIYEPAAGHQLIDGEDLVVRWTTDDIDMRGKVISVGIKSVPVTEEEKFTMPVMASAAYDYGEVVFTKGDYARFLIPGDDSDWPFTEYIIVMKTETDDLYASTAGRLYFGVEPIITSRRVFDGWEDEQYQNDKTLEWVGIVMSEFVNAPLLQYISHKVTVFNTGDWVIFWAIDDGVAGGAILYSTTENMVVMAFRGFEAANEHMLANYNELSMMITPYTLHYRNPFGYCNDKTQVHLGYYTIYRRMRETFYQNLLNVIKMRLPLTCKDSNEIKILFTGYDIGGALASLAAVDATRRLLRAGIDTNAYEIFLSTYGAPAFGNPEMIRCIHHNIYESRRKRFVTLFPKPNMVADIEDEGLADKPYQVPIRLLEDKTTVRFRIKKLYRCINLPARGDYKPMRGWTSGDVAWLDGDIVTQATLSCRPGDEALSTFNNYSKRLVFNPRLMHVDHVKLTWPTKPNMPFEESGGQYPLYPYLNDQSTCTPFEQGTTQKLKDDVLAALTECHNIVYYAKAIAAQPVSYDAWMTGVCIRSGTTRQVISSLLSVIASSILWW